MKDLVTLSDDIHQAKGSVTQFQAAMGMLLKRTPSTDEFNEIIRLLSLSGDNMSLGNEDRFLLEKLKQTLNSPQLKVAMKFKQLFEMDELPFLKMMTLIPLKSGRDSKELAGKEEVLNFLLEYHRTQETKNLGVDVKSEELKQFNEEISKNDNTKKDGLQVNAKGDLDIQLPDLLPIKDDKTFKRAFLHESFIDPVLEMENLDDITNYDNTKLIVRGKMMLQGILMEILMQKYPKLYHEDIIILMDRLMDDNILFKLGLVYNLVKNFKFKFSNRIAMADKLRIIASLFLSYMGGLSYEYSRCKLKLWVYSIYKWILPSAVGAEVFDNHQFICKKFEFLMNQMSIDYTLEPVEEEIRAYKLTVSDHQYLGSNSNDTIAQSDAINQFLQDKAFTSHLLDQFHHQQETAELQQASQAFKDFVQQKGIQVSYNQVSLSNLFHLTIKIDELVLSSTFDRDDKRAHLRGEARALENLKVLTNS